MTDLAVLFIGNKGFILFEELLKMRFQDSSNIIKLVIRKNAHFFYFISNAYIRSGRITLNPTELRKTIIHDVDLSNYDEDLTIYDVDLAIIDADSTSAYFDLKSKNSSMNCGDAFI